MMKPQETLPAIAIFWLFSVTTFGQAVISGNVQDDTGRPQEYANVLLLNPADSSLIRGGLTNIEGVFEIEQVEPGDYLLLIRSVGYSSQYSSPFTITEGQALHDAGTITLATGIALEEVNIVARKPLYEQKIDRMVVNVESSITSAGGTALEILERSPGVIVNRQNNAISLVGKDGVVIMINGKINYMPTSAIVQLLAGMSADNIERIELITTPPAQYDAEGNAGFINIVLKQNTEQGTNGSYTFMGGYGDGPRTSSNLSFFTRSEKFNVSGSYAFLWEDFKQFFDNYRRVRVDGVDTETYTISDRDPAQRDHNARLAIDYSLSPKTTLGILLAGYDNKWTMDAENDSYTQTNGIIDSSLTMLNVERNQWEHYMGNVNVQHKFSENHTLTFDGDLLHYRDENPNTYETSYFDGMGGLRYSESTRSGKITPIDIVVAKLDYSGTLTDKFKLNSGLKGVTSNFTNQVSVDRKNNGDWISDPDFTATSDLSENIFAAYASVEFNADEQTTVQAGLRFEYTDSNLGTDESPDVVDREFGSFFPSFFISRQINENNNLGLSYSRRITRPTFNDMAPFVIFFDPNTFFSGNTALQPAISNSVKFDYRYKTTVVSLQYTHEDSTIARFQDRVDPETNRQVIYPTNLKNRKTLSLSLGLPVYISNWWSMQNNILVIRQEVNSFYDGDPVRLQQTNFQINSVQSFNLPKDFALEVSGFYRSKQLWGIAVGEPFGALNIGLEKDLGERWGTLRIAVDDIFNSLQWEGGTILDDHDFETHGTYDFSRPTFTLVYSRRFGNTQLKEGRKRTTGSEEERNRVN